MTLQEPKTSTSADPDAPDTQVMVAPVSASPVFVDSTGRRGRRLRRASYAFGVLCMLYGGLVSVSLAGGPLSPNSVLPLRALADGAADLGRGGDDVRPSPLPEPATTTAPPVKTEVRTVLPRRAQPNHPLERAPAPPPKPPAAKSTKATPKATPSTSRPPSASPTPKPPSASPSSTPSPSAPATKTPAPPKPPASTVDTSGSGGGTEVSSPEVGSPEVSTPESEEVVDETEATTAAPTPSASTSEAGEVSA